MLILSIYSVAAAFRNLHAKYIGSINIFGTEWWDCGIL